MPRWTDFLPPILTRNWQRKELSGSIEFIGGLAQFLDLNGPTYRTARSYEKMAGEGYGGNVYLYRAVTLISQSIAGIPWQLYRRSTGAGDERDPVDNHPLTDLLNIEANAQDSGPELVDALVAYWLLAGYAYLYALRPNANRPPTELYALQPNLLRAKASRDGTLQSWEYQLGNGQKQEFAPEDVLRIKDFHPLNRAGGVAPAQVAARAIDQHNAANDWNAALLQNMARPSGLLTPKTDQVMPQEANENLKAQLQEKYSGPKNAGRPLVPRFPMQWQSMGQTAAEMDWLAGKVQSAREIAIPFGVPSELLGDAANKTYCIIGSMRVMTTGGPKPIADIRPGDVVWSLDIGTGQTVARPVLHQARTGHKEVMAVRANGRELVTTDTHPFLVRETRQKVASPHDNAPREFCFIYKPASELRLGDVLVLAASYPDSPEPESPHPVDADTMEFLGAMLGDGFAYDYGGGRAIVSMAGVPGPVREHYRSLATRLFTRHDGTPVTIKDFEREFRFISKSAVRWLGEMGVMGNAKTKRVPSWVFTQSLDLRRAFLRGIFDTDGSVSKKGHIAFASRNEELCRDVRDLAISCGLTCSNVDATDRVTRLPNGQQARNILWRFVAGTPALNLTIGSRNPADLRRMEEGAAAVAYAGRRHGMSGYSEGTRNTLLSLEHCEYAVVNKLERRPAEDVYDIEVEGNHNFFAEHICVHNSNMQEARKALYTETILPRMDRLKAAFTRFLLPMFGMDLLAYELDYDTDNIEALREDQSKIWQQLALANFLTVNEKREALGYDPLPGPEGDAILVSNTMESLTTALEAPQPVPPQLAPHTGQQPPPPPQLPPGQIVDANPPTNDQPSGGNGKALARPKATARTQAGDTKVGAGGGADPRRPLLTAARRQVADQFRAEADRLTATLRDAADAGLSPAEAMRRLNAEVQASASDWESLFDSVFSVSSQQAGDRLIAQFVSEGLLPAGTVYDSARAGSLLVDALTSGQSATAAQHIINTTLGTLDHHLSVGLDTSEIRQTIADLEQVYDDFQAGRVDTIADMQVVPGWSLGQLDAAFQAHDISGGTVQRTWRTVGDARVRPEHAAADGQTVGLDEPFTVGGEDLWFPGDPSGSPGNTINCRCSIDYSLSLE